MKTRIDKKRVTESWEHRYKMRCFLPKPCITITCSCSKFEIVLPHRDENVGGNGHSFVLAVVLLFLTQITHSHHGRSGSSPSNHILVVSAPGLQDETLGHP